MTRWSYGAPGVSTPGARRTEAPRSSPRGTRRRRAAPCPCAGCPCACPRSVRCRRSYRSTDSCTAFVAPPPCASRAPDTCPWSGRTGSWGEGGSDSDLRRGGRNRRAPRARGGSARASTRVGSRPRSSREPRPDRMRPRPPWPD